MSNLPDDVTQGMIDKAFPEALSDNVERQVKYDFIEDGHEERAERFYSFCWDKFRNQMRVMILAYLESDGEREFDEYLDECNKEYHGPDTVEEANGER